MTLKGASAKFILGGEHSVLYRGVSIAFPIPSLSLEILDEVVAPGLWINGVKRKTVEADRVVELYEKLGLAPRDSLAIRTNIPIGAGLGSSAALCVALLRKYSTIPAEQHRSPELAHRALEGEKVFHGSPSGVDPFVVTLEKPISFNRNMFVEELNLEAFKKSGMKFLIRYTGEAHRTLEVIEAVKNLKAQQPEHFTDIIKRQSDCAAFMRTALQRGEFKFVADLMNESHLALTELGVSTEKLDALVRSFKAQGALGAKLTGAGRGGCAVALVGPEFPLLTDDIVVV